MGLTFISFREWASGSFNLANGRCVRLLTSFHGNFVTLPVILRFNRLRCVPDVRLVRCSLRLGVAQWVY